MKLDALKKLYQCLERECRAIETCVSTEEKAKNIEVIRNLKRLKSSLHVFAKMIEAKEKRVIGS